MKDISLVDTDVLLYACGFAGQENRYLVSDAEGNPLVDFKIEKVTKDNYRALTSTDEAFHAHKRKDVLVLMQDLYPDGVITEYVKVEPLENVLHSAKLMITSIIEKSGGDPESARLFLSGDNNFRKFIDPEYKANRSDVSKPVYFDELKKYFIDQWGAEVVDIIEADDALGIAQTEQEEIYAEAMKEGLASECPRTVLCTIDKDLDMIQGLHYNWQKEKAKKGTGCYKIDQDQADLNFYQQLLVGDKTDNIEGIYGIGKVKAKKILQDCESNDKRLLTVMDTYAEHMQPKGESSVVVEELVRSLATIRMKTAGRLLWIQRHPQEEWYNVV